MREILPAKRYENSDIKSPLEGRVKREVEIQVLSLNMKLLVNN